MTALEIGKKFSIILSAIFISACVSQVDRDLQISADGKQVIYPAIAGESALSTLKRLTNIRTKTEEFGQFVTAINGIEGNGETHFWAFFVNGKKSREGAGSYIAKPGDLFEWRLIRRKTENAPPIIPYGSPRD